MNPNLRYRSNSFVYHKPMKYYKLGEIQEVLIPNNVIHVDFVNKKRV